MFVDEPMAEFWTPNGQGLDFQPTVKSMSSAAHLNGYAVVGAEAFTSGNREKWLWHPAMLKSIGDIAFAGGVNRLVFHRYAGQPFPESIRPGMQMGPWGLHYERTNTWWEFSKPWHDYLARCQYLLRQGVFVGDVLKVESEEPLERFRNIQLSGYDYDVCGPATFRRGEVRGERFVFPSGAAYRLIVLPDTQTMTVSMLSQVRDRIRAGAAVLGSPPLKTPGLTDFPKADDELKAIAEEIWGTDPAVMDRHLGQGRVFRNITPQAALGLLGVAADFTSDAGVKYIHRRIASADVYFIANTSGHAIMANCTFRVFGKQPEYWNPETGQRRPLPAYAPAGGNSTTLSVPFEPNGSAFIVFSEPARPQDRWVTLTNTRATETLLENGIYEATPPGSSPSFNAVDGIVLDSGPYVLTTADGKRKRFEFPNIPAPIPLNGPWQLRFPAGAGAPAEVTLEDLIPWNQHPNPGVKYFSGTATYSQDFTMPEPKNGERIYLDLGKVQVMAKVRLNGKDLGILWKPPHRVEISAALKAGETRWRSTW